MSVGTCTARHTSLRSGTLRFVAQMHPYQCHWVIRGVQLLLKASTCAAWLLSSEHMAGHRMGLAPDARRHVYHVFGCGHDQTPSHRVCSTLQPSTISASVTHTIAYRDNIQNCPFFGLRTQASELPKESSEIHSSENREGVLHMMLTSFVSHENNKDEETKRGHTLDKIYLLDSRLNNTDPYRCPMKSMYRILKHQASLNWDVQLEKYDTQHLATPPPTPPPSQKKSSNTFSDMLKNHC